MNYSYFRSHSRTHIVDTRTKRILCGSNAIHLVKTQFGAKGNPPMCVKCHNIAFPTKRISKSRF